MESVSENFNLHATMQAIGSAAVAVIGHMLFKFAIHGLIMALVLMVVGFILAKRKHRFGKPLMLVTGRMCIFCAILCLPGAYFLVKDGQLPDAGVFNVNSYGFISLWSLIFLHLTAEETYHRESKI
jgi:uncharacterized membrane protein